MTASRLVDRLPEAMGSKLKPRGARPRVRPAAHPIGRRHSLRSNRTSDGRQGPEPQALRNLLFGSNENSCVWIELELVEECVDLECACRTGIAKVQGDV